MLKNSRKYKKALLPLLLLSSSALAETEPRETRTPMLILLGVYVIANIVFFIWWGARGGKSENKKWAKYKDKLIWAKLWEPKDATLLDIQRGQKKILFKVKYQGVRGKHGIAVVPGSEDSKRILAHLADSKLKDDLHITETQILAVNNEQITSSEQHISISKALLGGLMAGDVGFFLGGLSGMSRGRIRNRPNDYTFLVKYDDRENRTEKVNEKNHRFQFLIQKLKA